MKVLVISAGFPYPPNEGGSLRIYKILGYLSAHHEITLVSFAWPNEIEQRQRLEQVCRRVYAVPYRVVGTGLTSRLRRGLTWRLSRPAMFRSSMMTAQLARLCRQETFDLVQIEHPWMAQHVMSWGLPKVVVAVDILAVQMERARRYAPVWRLPEELWAAHQNGSYEKWVYRQADVVIAVSEHDRQTLHGHYGLTDDKMTVVPNGVDLDYFRPSDDTPKPYDIGFVGKMSYTANQDGALWFASQILPLVHTELPEASFRIIGKDPSEKIRDLDRENTRIVVTGPVDDIRKELGSCAIAVVPLRQGAGTRVKVLEALAQGVPVVTTSIGVEGIDFVSGVHGLVADSAHSFSKAVVSVLRDEELRRRFRANGRRLVEARYGWRQMAARTDEVWRRLARRPNPASEPI